MYVFNTFKFIMILPSRESFFGTIKIGLTNWFKHGVTCFMAFLFRSLEIPEEIERWRDKEEGAEGRCRKGGVVWKWSIRPLLIIERTKVFDVTHTHAWRQCERRPAVGRSLLGILMLLCFEGEPLADIGSFVWAERDSKNLDNGKEESW